jgi:hypothetical protein
MTGLPLRQRFQEVTRMATNLRDGEEIRNPADA